MPVVLARESSAETARQKATPFADHISFLKLNTVHSGNVQHTPSGPPCYTYIYSYHLCSLTHHTHIPVMMAPFDMFTRLRHLDLCGCKLAEDPLSGAIDSIAALLSSNSLPHLRRLDLSKNCLRDDDCLFICAGMLALALLASLCAFLLIILCPPSPFSTHAQQAPGRA